MNQFPHSPFFLLGSKPETSLSPLTFVASEVLCQGDNCPLFPVGRAETHRAAPASSIGLSPLLIPQAWRARERLWLWLPMAWLWSRGWAWPGCECTGVKELCVTHVLIFGSLTTLGVGMYSYFVIIMISLLTFLSNVWINKDWYKRMFVFGHMVEGKSCILGCHFLLIIKFEKKSVSAHRVGMWK